MPNLNIEQIGGKAANLTLLRKHNYNVPLFEIIDADTFKKFIKANELEIKITPLLQELSNIKLSAKEINSISLKITRLIQQANISDDLQNIIQLKLNKIKFPISIRSSATTEDSSDDSFAGQFDTFLSINSHKDALDKIKKCWASLYSSRSLSYRLQKNIAIIDNKMSMSIILQEMIVGEKSGIIFTTDSLKNDSDSMIINVVTGTCDTLVSGKKNGDIIIVNKITKEITSQKNTILTQHEIKNIIKIALDIEKIYQSPQDIEWTSSQNIIYILQTRPITISNPTSDLPFYIWDNSNIVESYSGITLPLTFSFIRHAYHNVYVQFCEVLLMSQKDIQSMDSFLKNMLGIIHGRVYYNMINWYKLTNTLPGFKYNKKFMETMMGTSHAISDTQNHIISTKSSWHKIRIKLFAGCALAYYHLTINQRVNKFLTYFDNNYNHYKSINFKNKSEHESEKIFIELENKFLKEWKTPIINDFLCMIHFGIFKKLSNKWLEAKLVTKFTNSLLTSEQEIASMKPLQEILKLTQKIKANPKIKSIILNTPNKDCLNKIHQTNETDIIQRITDYLDLYGFRCANEMKLEQKDLNQDSSLLFSYIKNYLKYPDSLNQKLTTENDAVNLKNHILTKLNPLQKIIYKYSLKHAKKAIRNREDMRICRTKIYGIVRHLFFNIGEKYTNRKIINQADDIFYLTINEVFDSLNGTLSVCAFKQTIQTRKQVYDKYKTIQMPNRFTTNGPVCDIRELHSMDVSNNSKTKNFLKGEGSYPGIITKKIIVMKNLNDDIKLNGEILVAFQTDPGWIPLFPFISGLLIEKGSQLSHSAIIARELGIPTIVGIPHLIQKLKTGDIVTMDGETGIIKKV